jgi:hypothetical protein
MDSFSRRSDRQGHGDSPDWPQTAAAPALSPDAWPGGLVTRSTRRALLVLGGLALAAGGRAVRAAGDRKPSATTEARLKLAQAAVEAVRAHISRTEFNAGERDPLVIWSRRRLEARLDLSTTKAQRVAAAREHLDEMKGLEQTVIRMHEMGQIDRLTRMDAEYRRLEAENWLEQEQAKTS